MSYRRSEVPEPTPPSDPRQSPEIRLLLAWIDEAIGTTGAFETALLREQARAAGKLSPAARYLDNNHPLLPIFGLNPDDAVTTVIGGVDQAGYFRPGLAALTERECEILRYSLAGLTGPEIQQLVTSRRRRGNVPTVPLETIDQTLWRARVKLRALFLGEACQTKSMSSM